MGRLINDKTEALAFEAVLDHLVAQGWLPKRSRRRLDSTHVRGLFSAMSRLECVRETIRLFLEDVEAGGMLPEANRADGVGSMAVSPAIGWENNEKRCIDDGKGRLELKRPAKTDHAR